MDESEGGTVCAVEDWAMSEERERERERERESEGELGMGARREGTWAWCMAGAVMAARLYRSRGRRSQSEAASRPQAALGGRRCMRDECV